MNSVIKRNQTLSLTSLKMPLWFVKLFNFEYWNWMTFYAPIIPVWMYLGAKARSITFFTAVNPACGEGGFLKENKMEVLSLLPKDFLPDTHFVELKKDLPTQLIFPQIAKPNSGQRGRGVQKINSEADLYQYHSLAKESYVLQEFLEEPIELAIFYSRLPNERKGITSSITIKEFMTVMGDGVSTVKELMMKDDRFRLQLESLSQRTETQIDRVPHAGERLVLEPIGNHCRGTKFINAQELINEKLNAVFDNIMKDVKDFYYGRFDIKVSSLEDLYEGKGIKIMELNGVNGDPAHIFHPNYSLWQAYKDIYWHWNRMSKIAGINIANGVKPLPVSQVFHTIVRKFAT
jgi:hypothetical protein